MKSKAVFISPPHSTDFDMFKRPSWNVHRVPPIALLTLGSYLNASGHDIKIIDSRELIVRYKTNEYIPIILKIIDEFNPDIIGINVMTALFDEANIISREIRMKFPKSVIIAGGVHPSIEPVLTFQQNQYIDAVCIGPGEEVCLDILDGKSICNIQGLMLRDNIEKFENRDVVLDIDKYPFPNYDLVNRDYYTDFTTFTTVGWGYKGISELTSRGCPYACNFCATDWSKPFRYHSPEYIVELAKYLSTFDIDAITFWDDTMAANKERLYKTCEGFINSKLFWPHSKLRWFGAMRANQADPDMLKMMKRAGCFGTGIGIESGSDRLLKVMNKKTTVEMNKRACAYVSEAGLYLATTFMLGNPGETEMEMNETVAFMKNLKNCMKSVGIFRPLPGSRFYYEFINNNTLPKEHIDWSDFGLLTKAPQYTFCDVPREKLEEIYDNAQNKVFADSWTVIHEDILTKYPELVKNIARLSKVKIVKSDNYESSMHIPYAPFSPFMIYWNTLLGLYTHLPYKIRGRIKTLVKKLATKKYFKPLLWRFV
jgi:radical SAM superfamily enzyme YgiQ (UPF0313 family)